MRLLDRTQHALQPEFEIRGNKVPGLSWRRIETVKRGGQVTKSLRPVGLRELSYLTNEISSCR